MANALDTRRNQFKVLLNRDLTDADIAAVGGVDALQRAYGDNSDTAQADEIRRSGEFADLSRRNLRTKAEGIYGPSYQNTLTQLNLSGNQLNLEDQRIGQQGTEIGRQYDTLNKTLQEQADATRRGFEERQNQLGLLPSGGTAAGLGKIASDTNLQFGQNEQDRVSKLADLALQRAGLSIQKAGLESQKSLATATYGQNIDEAVKKLTEEAATAQADDKTFDKSLGLSKFYADNWFNLDSVPTELLDNMLKQLGLYG